jgi:hypothetical protein
MHHELSLGDDFAVDFSDLVRTARGLLTATIKGDEDNNDQPQKYRNDPGAFLFS